MGEAKKLQKQIASLKARVAEHRIKIAEELEKDFPDYGEIHHWEAEVAGWVKQIETKEAKLARRRKRGG